MSYEQPDHPPSDVGAEATIKAQREHVDRLTSDKARLAAELANKHALFIAVTGETDLMADRIAELEAALKWAIAQEALPDWAMHAPQDIALTMESFYKDFTPETKDE